MQVVLQTVTGKGGWEEASVEASELTQSDNHDC